ncbi:MBL fold metallo-hydrolase [Maridesulfovibrio sp. FT414]|uniref:MBL fold metallo-hydrolase n=1 Tax=Maridesulfovibrio sp. FT414 TaxID=2979469 RepID=UPI003D807A53
MKICITHIFHNCFVLDAGASCYVFDIPSERFRTTKALEALQRAVAARDVIAFFTHSHTDHFAPDYHDVCSGATSLKAVISDDIEEMFPNMCFRDVLVVEPDAKYEFEGLGIETMMSNDLGVAYIIRTPERLKIYNGGDLACWDWDNASLAERNFVRNFFRDAVRKVASEKVHVTFSNVDRRLSNLAGGPQFVEVVQPQVFVPTHAFGRTEWLDGIHAKLGLDESKCFTYRRAGDSRYFDIEI